MVSFLFRNSLMTYAVQHHFLCSFSICLFSLVMCLFMSSTHFLLFFFFFSFYYYWVFLFLLHSMACRILVLWPGIEPEVWQWKHQTRSPYHWTIREFLYYRVLSVLCIWWTPVFYQLFFFQSAAVFWFL